MGIFFQSRFILFISPTYLNFASVLPKLKYKRKKERKFVFKVLDRKRQAKIAEIKIFFLHLFAANLDTWNFISFKFPNPFLKIIHLMLQNYFQNFYLLIQIFKHSNFQSKVYTAISLQTECLKRYAFMFLFFSFFG